MYTNCIGHKTQRHKKFPELHGHYIITCGQCFQKTECLLLAFPFPKELFSIMRFCLNQDRVFMDLMTKILLCMTFLITSMTLWNADSSSKDMYSIVWINLSPWKGHENLSNWVSKVEVKHEVKWCTWRTMYCSLRYCTWQHQHNVCITSINKKNSHLKHQQPTFLLPLFLPFPQGQLTLFGH